MNTHTLTFAVVLLTGAALGDRFGRRRMFVLGVSVFTLGSVVAAQSTSVEMLWGLVRGNAQGWASPEIAVFSLANLASLLMYFGMFGSVFLLTQFRSEVGVERPSLAEAA